MADSRASDRVPGSGPSFANLRMNASQTAPGGVVNAETIFEFTQSGETVEARYAGGGIAVGRLIGRASGGRLEFRYVQVTDDGRLDGGRSICDIERTEDGRLRLIERFEWASREGGGTNVIEEIEI